MDIVTQPVEFQMGEIQETFRILKEFSSKNALLGFRVPIVLTVP